MYSNLREDEEEIFRRDSDGDERYQQVQDTSDTPDRFYLVYASVFFCGVVTLLPWNFFITAINFFQFKLRNTSVPAEDYLNPDTESYLQSIYENYLVIFASICNCIFMALNVVLTKRCGRNCRYFTGNILLLIAVVVVVVLTTINTDQVQLAFFCIAILMGALSNAGCAFTQGSMLGLSGMFPEKYTKALFEGQAIGGLTAVFGNILSIYLAANPIASGRTYFLIAIGFIVLSIVVYTVIPHMAFSKRYLNPPEMSLDEDVCNTSSEDLEPILYEGTDGSTDTNLGVWTVLWTIKWQAFGVLYAFFVTYCVFPSILSKIRPMKVIDGDPWTNQYFTPVICFLIFNLFDYIGRFMIGFVGVIGKRMFWLHITLVLLRTILIPLFFMCNVQPRTKSIFPLVFTNDAWPAVFTGLLGITNGYTATSSIILSVARVNVDNADLAGNVAVMFLVFGLTLGGFVSLGLVQLI